MRVRMVLGPVVALALAAGCSSSGSDGVTVSVRGSRLVGAGNRTLYVNSAESTTHLVCRAACLIDWPPVRGNAKAGPGVDAAKLGSFKRPDATMQATWAGHPLYAYAADKAAGDTRGTGIETAGGIWLPAPRRGIVAPRPIPAGGVTGGGYGDG